MSLVLRRGRWCWRRGDTAAGQDLNATDLGIIFDAGKLDRDLPSGIWRCRKLFHDRLVGPSCSGVDVEVAQDLLPIDRDIEESLSTTGPVDLVLVQPHRVLSLVSNSGRCR